MNALRVYGPEHKVKLKLYYIKHKEQITERHKQYYLVHKDKILATRKQKMTCECKCVVRRGDYKRHLKTKKHQKLINNQ